MVHAIRGHGMERRTPYLELTFGALMVVGWVLLGSFIFDRVVQHVDTWWKLFLSAPMIISAGVFVIRHD